MWYCGASPQMPCGMQSTMLPARAMLGAGECGRESRKGGAAGRAVRARCASALLRRLLCCLREIVEPASRRQVATGRHGWGAKLQLVVLTGCYRPECQNRRRLDSVETRLRAAGRSTSIQDESTATADARSRCPSGALAASAGSMKKPLSAARRCKRQLVPDNCEAATLNTQ